jgi:hypothetical protein
MNAAARAAAGPAAAAAAAALGSSGMLMHSRHHQHQQHLQQHHHHLPPHVPTAASSRMLAPSRHQQQQQQHYQQQQQQHLPLLHHPSMHGMHSTQMLQFFPSTMYPGGPSAAAALSQLQMPHALQQHPGSCSLALHALGASLMTQSAAGSDFLPANETDDLSSRVAASQSLLQSFYESQDLTVQHRQHNRVHARSVMLGHSSSAAAAAAAVAAMAAAAQSHGAVPAGEW